MKDTVKSLKASYIKYKGEAQKFLSTLQFPAKRRLLSIDAADPQGKLNGLTVVELLTIVNLTNMQGEDVFLSAQNKTITAWAVKKAPQAPMELL